MAKATTKDVVLGSRWMFTDDCGKERNYELKADETGRVSLKGGMVPALEPEGAKGRAVHLTNVDTGRVAGLTVAWLLGNRGPGTWELVK